MVQLKYIVRKSDGKLYNPKTQRFIDTEGSTAKKLLQKMDTTKKIEVSSAEEARELAPKQEITVSRTAEMSTQTPRVKTVEMSTQIPRVKTVERSTQTPKIKTADASTQTERTAEPSAPVKTEAVSKLEDKDKLILLALGKLLNIEKKPMTDIAPFHELQEKLKAKVDMPKQKLRVPTEVPEKPQKTKAKAKAKEKVKCECPKCDKCGKKM